MALMLPGDSIELDDDNKDIIIGPGFRKEGNKLIATKCGVYKTTNKISYWIEAAEKRYVPVRNEHVIGIVTMKTGESFKVDIGGSEYASLSYLAFENATKRYRPNVDIGDLIYCKILTGDKDIEPELVCIESDGKAHGMGLLAKGFMFRVGLDLCRRLLSVESTLLKSLGSEFKFEIAVGLNGLIWLNSERSKDIVFLMHAIIKYDNIKESETEAFVKNLLNEDKMQ